MKKSIPCLVFFVLFLTSPVFGLQRVLKYSLKMADVTTGQMVSGKTLVITRLTNDPHAATASITSCTEPCEVDITVHCGLPFDSIKTFFQVLYQVGPVVESFFVDPGPILIPGCLGGPSPSPTPCGYQGQNCCLGNACYDGLTCQAGKCEVAPSPSPAMGCAVFGATPLPGQVCCTGLELRGGVCKNPCRAPWDCCPELTPPCTLTTETCIADGGGTGPGHCFPCGRTNQFCCGGTACEAGAHCVPNPPSFPKCDADTPPPCGMTGQLCCGDRTPPCDTGAACKPDLFCP